MIFHILPSIGWFGKVYQSEAAQVPFCCLSCFGSHVLRCHGDFYLHVCEIGFRQGGVRGVLLFLKEGIWSVDRFRTRYPVFFFMFLLFFFASNRAQQVGREEEEEEEERATEWMDSDWIGRIWGTRMEN